GDIDARSAGAGREWAGGRVPGVARFLVDLLVRAGDEDIRVIRIDGERRLILLVLRERSRRAANTDQRITGGQGRDGPGDKRDARADHQQNLLRTPSVSPSHLASYVSIPTAP